jgi:hypothetical protein
MRRVEQATDDSGAAYAQFQRAAMLEDQVRERTHDLGRALDLLERRECPAGRGDARGGTARQNLSNAIETVQEGFALFDREERLVMCNSASPCTCRTCAPSAPRAGLRGLCGDGQPLAPSGAARGRGRAGLGAGAAWGGTRTAM